MKRVWFKTAATATAVMSSAVVAQLLTSKGFEWWFGRVFQFLAIPKTLMT
jgi:hypothetical protein